MFRPRNLVILAGICAAAVLISRGLILDRASAEWFEAHLGYFWVLAALLWWGFETLAWFRAPVGRIQLRSLFQDRVALVIVPLTVLFLHLHEPHMMKVFHDEPSHVAGSLMMHRERMAVMPGSGHLFMGGILLMESYASFRMYLFQVLLSLIHDVSGFRVENVFVLNGLISIVYVALMYIAGRCLAGVRGGVLAVLAIAGLPLLAQNVTSGGYDVLNITLIVALLLAGRNYLQRPGSEGLNLFVSTAVLAALSRYESILYVIMPIALVLLKWRREKSVSLTPAAALSPLLTLPSFAANVLMTSTDVFMNKSIRGDRVGYFDLSVFPQNLNQAIYYFFSIDTNSTNSALLGLSGLVALLGMAVIVIRRHIVARVALEDGLMVLLLTSVIACGFYLVTLTHFWGMPTEFAAARFTLPTYTVFALCTVWFLHDCFPTRIPGVILGAFAVHLAVFAIPANAKHYSTNRLTVAHSHRWFMDYAAAQTQQHRRVLFASRGVLATIVHGYPAVPTGVLLRDPEKVILCLRAGLYDEIVIQQDWVRDLRNNTLQSIEEQNLETRFVTEVIAETSYHPRHVARISRIVGLKNEDGSRMTKEQEPVLKRNFRDDDEQLAYLKSLLP